MGYDPVRRVVVMFGGRRSEGVDFLDDTWLWDGRAWSEAHPQHVPEKVEWGFQMAFDAERSVLVMQQGSNTWTWNGQDWTLALTHGPPISFGLAYDPDRKLVVGQNTIATYVWDGKVWHASHQSSTGSIGRAYGAMAWDGAHHSIVMFGGGTGGTGTSTPYSDTWLMQSGIWTKANPSTSPPGAYLNQMWFDNEIGAVFDFGGASADVGVFNQVWAWDGPDWRAIQIQGGPAPLYGVAAAYDSERHEVVVFGGLPASAKDPNSQTWTLRGDQWTKRTGD